MSCLGVLFALTPEQEEKLLSLSGDEALIDFVVEDIEEAWDQDWLAETDKSWYAMHLCLNTSPDGAILSKAILGGNLLTTGDDYYVYYVNKDDVQAVAAAIKTIDEEAFTQMYAKLEHTDYVEYSSDEDREFTWGWFTSVQELYGKAAAANRTVIFAVDQ